MQAALHQRGRSTLARQGDRALRTGMAVPVVDDGSYQET